MLACAGILVDLFLIPKFRTSKKGGPKVLINAEYEIPNSLPRGLSDGAMPMEFGSVNNEVVSCQETAALFDYSFLLRLIIQGPDAIQSVSGLCSRDFSDLSIGSIRYGLLSDRNGWLVSDLTVWRSKKDQVEIMSGRAEDVPVIRKSLASYNVKILDLSEETAVLALQGPRANKVFSSIAETFNIGAVPYFGFQDLHFCGVACRVARLGYTGLDGIEILCSPKDARELWKRLSPHARPAGFFAADYLRLQAGLPLFTQEFKPPVSAADIGLKRVRPDGKLYADQRLPEVTRVCFSARKNVKRGRKIQDLSDLLWSPEKPFPPDPGALAITSITRDVVLGGQIGMGYIARVQEENELL